MFQIGTHIFAQDLPHIFQIPVWMDRPYTIPRSSICICVYMLLGGIGDEMNAKARAIQKQYATTSSNMGHISQWTQESPSVEKETFETTNSLN